MTKRICSSTSK